MKPIETVDKCTTCSTCVAYCPVTKATRAFKGPKLTGPSSERFRLYDETGGGEISEIEALDYCSNCKNCDIACPSGVKISTLNMLARAEYCKRHKPPLRDWVLSHGRMLGRLVRRFPGWLVNVGSTNALTRLILDKFGVDARAPMPVFVPRSFTEWMGDHNAMLTASDRSRLTKKAVFFPGCYVNDYDPQTGKDLVFMLEKAGYEVIVPEFECCGLPMVANGFFDDARAAGLLGDMDPDDAADIVRDLSYEKAETLLRLMGVEDATEIRRLLGYKDGTAGGMMTTQFVAVKADNTVGETIEVLRELDDDHPTVHYVYVLNDYDEFVGVLSLRTLVLTDDARPVRDVMFDDVISATPDETEEDVAADIFKYELPAMPVVDEHGVLLGIVTVDDAWDAIEEDVSGDKTKATLLKVLGGLVASILFLALYTLVLLQIIGYAGR